MNLLEQIARLRSWQELQGLFTLEEVKTALRAREQQRLYHKKQYLKRQAVLDKARTEHPEWFKGEKD